MVKLYLGSCDELSSADVVDGVCDYLTSKLNQNELFIYAPLGKQNGDIICRNYAVARNIGHEFLKPRQMSKREIMEQCDYAIVFNSHNDSDAGHANGVDCTLKNLSTFIKKKLVEVNYNTRTLTIHDCSQRGLTYNQLKPPIECNYWFENGKIIIKKQSTVIKEYKMANKI